MSSKYQKLITCFENWGRDSLDFLKGQSEVFEGFEVLKDSVFDKLVEPNDNFDTLTVQALELIFSSLVVKTKRLLSDHLKGRKYDLQAEDEKLRQETRGVMKTNVIPERDFGMLDRLVMEKPRSTTLVYEGIIMFNKNQTGAWRDKLPMSKKHEVMKMAQESKETQKKAYAARQLEIRRKRIEKMTSRAEEEEKKAQKLRVKKQLLMGQIEKFGLWKSEEKVKENLKDIDDENVRIKLLSLQIQFRKVVLSAFHPDKEIFQMSAKGKKFDSQRLFHNLCALIAKANEEVGAADLCPDTAVTLPSVIPQETLLRQKELYQQEAEKVEEKSQNKRKQGGASPQIRKKRKNVHPETVAQVPTINIPEDLLGKRVRHLCVSDDGSGDEGQSKACWYEGFVVSMTGKGLNPEFQLKYDGYDGTWEFKLMKHLEYGILELVELKEKHLLGAKVLHRLNVDGCEEWFRGKVLGQVPGSDPENPEFSVEYEGEVCPNDYDDVDELEYEEETYNVENYPLFEDYLNGDHRFL